MALINVGGATSPRRQEDDPLAAMFSNLPPAAKLQQPGPPPATPTLKTPPVAADPLSPQPTPTTTSMRPEDENDSPPPPSPQPPPPQPQTTAPFSFDQINALYQQYLGRAASQAEYQGWASGTFGPPNLPSVTQQIQNSEEAARYRAAHGGGSTPSPNTPTPSGSGPSSPDLAQSMLQRLNAGGQTMSARDMVDEFNRAYPYLQALYYNDSRGETIGFREGYLAKTPQGWTWTVRGPEGASNPGGNPAPGGYPGTNVFDDPATANFEKLLNELINRFNTSQTPPHYQQAIDQLNAYLAKLNGPVYTPAEMELMQTQAWDPMQQQHDAAKQQLIQRLGAQGISPSSGIFEKALEDLDRQFQQAHTQVQSGFANSAIDRQRQNWATAATLAPQISNFEQAQTSWQDSRSLQAEMLAALIPQMASQRLRDASGSIQGLNPTGLLSMLQSFQNQGYGQNAQYGSAIMQLLAQLFGLGG